MKLFLCVHCNDTASVVLRYTRVVLRVYTIVGSTAPTCMYCFVVILEHTSAC
jgi:hypothetical protein